MMLELLYLAALNGNCNEDIDSHLKLSGLSTPMNDGVMESLSVMIASNGKRQGYDPRGRSETTIERLFRILC